MGGEGSIAGMITSLRNNANLRLNRKHFFSNKRQQAGSDTKKVVKPNRIKRSPEQIQQARQELKAMRRKDLFVRLFAVVVATIIAVLILFFIFGTSAIRI